MICPKCGTETVEDRNIQAYEFGFGVLVIRNIPCMRCEKCGEIFYSAETIEKTEEIRVEKEKDGREISIVNFEDV